jgi:hypothetical protein
MNFEPLLSDIDRIKKRERIAKKSIISNIDNVINLLQNTQKSVNTLESLDPKLEVSPFKINDPIVYLVEGLKNAIYKATK